MSIFCDKFCCLTNTLICLFLLYSCTSDESLNSNSKTALRSTVTCAISDSESVEYPVCSYNLNEGKVCSLTLAQIRPTQFNFGEEYVYKIVSKFLNNVKKNQEIYCKKPLNIVIGPSFNQGYFLTDGHHRMKSIEIFKTEHNIEYTILFKIERNYFINNYVENNEEFWKDMEKNNFVYLKDKGKLRSAEELPKKISELTNDPLRSLLAYIADDGLKFCFNTKSPTYGNFAEFKWAEYFRTFKEISEYYDGSNYCEYRQKIINLKNLGNICKLPQAKDLPGFLLEKIVNNKEKIVNCN